VVHKLSDFFWRKVFANRALRARVAFQVKYRCLHELDLRIPLGYGISVPWFDQEIGSSFTEIFLEQEYSRLFEFIEAPTRWIDLGAFAGFFSIWLLWNRRRLVMDNAPCEALLIDADEVRTPYIRDLFRINNLTEKFRFRHGAIGSGKETCKFVHTPWMGSALASITGTNTNAADVPILTAAEILSIFGPPFELLKVDIEGAEYDLFKDYHDLLCCCENLLLEWHSWHPGKGGLGQLQALASEAGFEQIAELQPPRNVNSGQTGVVLLHRVRQTQSTTS
jgi:FkbM family methyltransferase